MENLINFLEVNISYQLLSIIILGGVFLTKYTKGCKFFGVYVSDAYKVLFASVVLSVVFYFLESCGRICWPKYLFTYLFATSFYELIVKVLLNKVDKVVGKNTSKETEV